MARKQEVPRGRAWHIERGKNTRKNKREDWEYPAKMRRLGRTKKVNAYTKRDGTRVRAYWKKPSKIERMM